MLWLWWSRSGSSPLARGTRQRQSHVPGHVRLIPARAGNTYFPPFRARAGTAHPRSRGEHSLVIMCQPAMFGSSPLARGTLIQPARESQQPRLIPARAGNTFGVSAAGTPESAHPRSRGEHLEFLAVEVTGLGSSPLARGTRILPPVTRDTVRLIPARAGNTPPVDFDGSEAPAHPRSRGEHCGVINHALAFTGSSPLARGTLLRQLAGAVHGRLIPARAGNTYVVDMSIVASAAHPRSRGEHLMVSHSPAAFCGSSPLARGPHLDLRSVHGGFRLIPARAGNTQPARKNIKACTAHPRSRGEHMRVITR